MSTETRLAFAHPEERAAATAPPGPRDRISLRDHVVDADIGAFQSERGQHQRLRFNVVVEVRPHPAPLADDVDRILSYDRIAQAIAAELAAGRVNLLETLAERVAERIFAAPQAMRIFVRVEKLDRGPGALGVEIVRARDAQAGTDGGTRAGVEETAEEAAEAAPRPLVVFLANAAVAGDGLAARLDALEASGAPVILCVGLPDGARPEAASTAAQRRIDLLAIEQNAWVLADRDRRCVVVESRTEIDWAMRNGQMIVWAPSKLVLASADAPRTSPEALALWLAEALTARRLILVGGSEAPESGLVPVEVREP